MALVFIRRSHVFAAINEPECIAICEPDVQAIGEPECIAVCESDI